MFAVINIGGVNVIVPAFVRGGRICVRINRTRILAAVGLPAHACVRWG